MEKGSAVFRVKYAHVKWALICDLRDCLAHPGSYGLILRVREKRPILSFKFAKRGEKRPTESVSPDRRQQCSVSRMRGRFSRPRAEPVSSRPIYARRRQVGRPSRGGPARAPINQPLIIRRAQRERDKWPRTNQSLTAVKPSLHTRQPPPLLPTTISCAAAAY
jgi:hypothetical protein